MFSAILASIGYAGGVVVDKLALSVERLSTKVFIPLLFAFLAGITLLYLPFFGGMVRGLSLGAICLFVFMLLVATVWNIFYYESLQKENLHEFELIMLFSPLLTVLFAEIFLPAERNLGLFFAALVASTAFVVSRIESHHIEVTRVAKKAILAVILFSFESILIRYLLNFFEPATLYFFRTLAVGVVFLLLYKPNFHSVSKKSLLLVFASAAFGVLQMILKFYGFRTLGVIETTMILLLGSFMVYGFSYFYFHEKRNFKKDLACGIVVIGCIIYSTLAR
ncbi:MAG: DMT family transporter [Candidatus Berkelbacteria bacterium]|nr:DMT family transporter [Candidatus Berkelbacteria bacterium]